MSIAARLFATLCLTVIAAPLAAQPDAKVLTPRIQGCANVGARFDSTTSTYLPAAGCSIHASEPGTVLIHATASVARADGNAETRLLFEIDGSLNDLVERWVNTYADDGDGTDINVALTMVRPVTRGSHTFRLMASRNAGSGGSRLFDPHIVVIFVPATQPGVALCGSADSSSFQTTNASFGIAQQCDFQASEAGVALVFANATAGAINGAVESYSRIAVDSLDGVKASERWTNGYPDSGDGADQTLSTQVVQPVSAGSHVVALLASRSQGAGTVLLRDPAIAALYLSNTVAAGSLCSVNDGNSFLNTTEAFATVNACSLTPTEPALALIFGSASVAKNAIGEAAQYEAQLRLGVDSPTGASASDRFVNVYNDVFTDGTDRSYANSYGEEIAPGPHTFYSVAKRFALTGDVRLYAPSLAVLLVAPDNNLLRDGFE